MEEIKAEIELEIKGKKNTFEMIIKEPSDLEDLEDGHIVMLNLKNGEQYTGIFDGLDEYNEILLKSLESDQRIGLKIWWVRDYLEGPLFNY